MNHVTGGFLHSTADILVGLGAPAVVVVLFVLGWVLRKTHRKHSSYSLALCIAFACLFGGFVLLEQYRGEVAVVYEPTEWHARAATLLPVGLTVDVRQGTRRLLSDTIPPFVGTPMFAVRRPEASDSVSVVLDDVVVGVIEASDLVQAGFHRGDLETGGRVPLWSTNKLEPGAARVWDCEDFSIRIIVDSVTTPGGRQPPSTEAAVTGWP